MTDVNQGPSSVPSLDESRSTGADPTAVDREALSIVEGPDATVAVGRKTADPVAAPGIVTAAASEPAPDATTALGPDSPARRTGGHSVNPSPKSARPFPIGLVVGIGGGLLVVGGLAAAWLGGAFRGPAADPVALPSPEPPAETEVPPALRAYLQDAQKGDAKAMRMLGVMYYNGLNCPQNREEGRKWFVKAAEAGSDAARKDLEQLGLPVPPKKP